MTSIGQYAFNGCSTLKSVKIPEGVTTIGRYAFDYCTKLTSIIIPNTIRDIEEAGFAHCDNLSYLTISNGVINIGNYAFSGCYSLVSVNIPETVTRIGDYAFWWCSGLTSVTISESVTNIGNHAFDGCSGLTKAEFASIESLCKINFGSSNANPLYYAKHLYINGQEITDVVIPNSVTSIGESVFYNCSGLTSITIPNSVTSIGSSAFSNCSSLTSITIPNSVTSIGESVFYNCSGLTSVTIPNSVTSIGNSAFSNCSSLTSITISNSVTSIGSEAFRGCSSLTSVTIPSSVISIGSNAFPSDTKIYVNKGVSALIAVWYYGRNPYDLSTNTILTNPLDNRITSCASSIRLAYSNPTNLIKIENESLTINGVTKTGHTANVTGLKPDYGYYVTYNATITYGGESITYTIKEKYQRTSTLSLTLSQPKVISLGNVIVAATSNLDDEEENVGFEWRRMDWPDEISSNSGIAYLYEGTMEGYIRSLNTNYYWKVRPYYKANDGTYYYGEWGGFDPTNTSYFEPTVHTYAKINVTGNKAQVSGYVQRASDAVIRQGFKYWIQEDNAREAEDNARGAGITIPTSAKTVEAEGRIMEAELTGLKPNTTYAYVAFVTTTEGETFYGKQLTFTTEDDPDATVLGDANGNGEVEIGDVTSVLTLMATPEATGYNNKAADANENGEIEIGDVTTILTIMANGE